MNGPWSETQSFEDASLLPMDWNIVTEAGYGWSFGELNNTGPDPSSFPGGQWSWNSIECSLSTEFVFPFRVTIYSYSLRGVEQLYDSITSSALRVVGMVAHSTSQQITVILGLILGPILWIGMIQCITTIPSVRFMDRWLGTVLA